MTSEGIGQGSDSPSGSRGCKLGASRRPSRHNRPRRNRRPPKTSLPHRVRVEVSGNDRASSSWTIAWTRHEAWPGSSRRQGTRSQPPTTGRLLLTSSAHSVRMWCCSTSDSRTGTVTRSPRRFGKTMLQGSPAHRGLGLRPGAGPPPLTRGRFPAPSGQTCGH